MRFLTFILAGAMICPDVLAADSDASHCAAIEPDMERLACFDEVFSAKIDPELARDNWTIEFQQSEFKDTTDVFLSLESDNLVTCKFTGRKPNKLTLMLMCRENVTSLVIGGECYFPNALIEATQVEIRAGKHPLQELPMNASYEKTSVGLWTGREAIPVIKSLLGEDHLLLRFSPLRMGPVTARFTISGVDEAVKSLRAECGW